MSNVEKHIPFNGVKDSRKVRVTIVQSSTGYNDTPATLEKYIEEAAKDKAELVVVPEGFIGGYPRGFRFGLAVGVHNTEGSDEFQKYHASAIQVPGAAIWGQGDGSTIPVYDTSIGKLGAVICWENRMPLYRTALYAKEIEIYCAPTADGSKEWQSSMMHIALEGGCFVLAVCQFCQRKHYPEHPDYLFTDWDDNKEDDAIVSQGGSVIISPFGQVLAGPNFDSEGLVTATLGIIFSVLHSDSEGLVTYWLSQFAFSSLLYNLNIVLSIFNLK